MDLAFSVMHISDMISHRLGLRRCSKRGGRDEEDDELLSLEGTRINKKRRRTTTWRLEVCQLVWLALPSLAFSCLRWVSRGETVGRKRPKYPLVDNNPTHGLLLWSMVMRETGSCCCCCLMLSNLCPWPVSLEEGIQFLTYSFLWLCPYFSCGVSHFFGVSNNLRPWLLPMYVVVSLLSFGNLVV